MSDIGEDSDFSSIEISSDEEDLYEARVKNQDYLEVTVPSYSENVFFEHFRLSRDLVSEISLRYENSAYCNTATGQYGNISTIHQVLIFLWYTGHQTVSFRDVGDRFNVTISTVFRIIRRVTLFLSNLSPTIIKWPTNEEKVIIEQHFRANGFPGIIGAIDGCHLKIDKPENNADSYINRKGYYSIQMQVICDHNRKILDVFIGYPGSCHDSRVFQISPIKDELAEKCGDYFLLGDSGYPLQRNLLTPYKDRGNLTRRQVNYNIKLARNRYVIEHCFGILKQKFRQLYHIKIRNIRFIVHFIRAACVLHNLALTDNFPLFVEPEENNDQDEDFNNDPGNDQMYKLIRDRVASSLPL